MNRLKPFAGVGVLLFAVLVIAHAQWATQESLLTSSPVAEALPPFDLPLVSPIAVPETGTFWSAQHAGEWPPLPFNPVADFGVDVYSLGSNNNFLYDDRLIDYPALEAELAAAKLLVSMSSGLPEFPGEGEEGEGGEWTNNYVGMVFGTNDLYLTIVPDSLTNGTATLTIHNPEDATNEPPAWLVWAVTNLSYCADPWALDADNWAWVASTESGQTNLTVPLLSETEAYYRLADPLNDADGDGIPDYYSWLHFAHQRGWASDLSRAEDDYDSDGYSNGVELTNSTNPNDIVFDTRFPDFFVNQTNLTGACEVTAGVPFEMALLVNSTNLTTAQWLPYASNFSATLGSTDGIYTVRVALRGHATNFPPVWDDTEIILDRVAPTLAITHPASANATVIKPYLQLQGLTDEPLIALSYNLSNAFGLATNVPASVIEQEFDTNAFDFTTNWFQAYDVPLTTNLNHLLLTVTDRAGNVTSTNLFITLDYTGATNPPVAQLLWPTNGSSIAGDTMTVRGQINDETAQVSVRWVAAGVTIIRPGTVERNGLFWIQDLPLDAGTNTLTLAAVDAAGNLSESSFTAIRGSLTVNVTSSPEGDQLYEAQGYVGGTVSDFNAVVTVNGVTTTNDGYGNWSAANVPLNGSGLAAFDVSATPASGPIEHLAFTKVTPAAIRVVKHYVKQTVNTSTTVHTWTKSYRAWDEPGSDGLTRHRYQGTASSYDSVPIYGTSLIDYAWSDTNVVGSYQATYSLGGDTSGPMTENDWLVKTVPDEQLDHTVGNSPEYVQHFYARGVRHEWEYPDETIVETLEARTVLRYYAPGPAETGRDSLRWLGVDAWTYGKPQTPDWTYTPSEPVPDGTVLVNGRPLGLDGREWQVAANGSSQDLHLKLGDANHAGLNQEHGEPQLKISWGSVGDVTDQTTVCWAGQTMNLTASFDPPLPSGSVASNYQWTVPGPAYADIDYTSQRGLTPPLTNLATNAVLYYWAKEFEDATVQCAADVGGTVKKAVARFEVRKPEVVWTLTPKFPVGVYTNYALGPGYWLACGLGGGDTNNSGMVFEWSIPSIASLKGYTNEFFDIRMLQIVETTIKENFVAPIGTNLSRSISTNGLDSQYPYDRWDPVMPPGLFSAFHDYDYEKDSPGELLSGATSFSHRSESFTSVLLFRPDGGKPVPLKTGSWVWAGGAVLAGTNSPPDYQLNAPPTNPQAAMGQPLDTPPTWSANIIDLTAPNSPLWVTNSTLHPTD